MAVSKSAFKIIKRAVEIRISRGEEIHEVVNSYPKLSDEQKQQIIDELAPKDEKSTAAQEPAQVDQPTTEQPTATDKPAQSEESTQAEPKTSTEESTPKTAE